MQYILRNIFCNTFLYLYLNSLSTPTPHPPPPTFHQRQIEFPHQSQDVNEDILQAHEGHLSKTISKVNFPTRASRAKNSQKYTYVHNIVCSCVRLYQGEIAGWKRIGGGKGWGRGLRYHRDLSDGNTIRENKRRGHWVRKVSCC